MIVSKQRVLEPSCPMCGSKDYTSLNTQNPTDPHMIEEEQKNTPRSHKNPHLTITASIYIRIRAIRNMRIKTNKPLAAVEAMIVLAIMGTDS